MGVMNLIFASDLDRTLVFSSHFDRIEGAIHPENFVVLDYIADREFTAYMDVSDLDRLKEISHSVEFIPVTARTRKKLDVLKLHELGVRYRYAIIENGAEILVDGETELGWENHVKSFDYITEPNLIVEELSSVLKDTEIVLGKFSISVFDCSDVVMDKVSEVLESYSDRYYLLKDHRRIFVMFKGIDKGSALKYLRDNFLRGSEIVAAGDAVMDLSMLEVADLGLVCDSGYLNGVDLPYRRSGFVDYRSVGWVLDNVVEHFGLYHKD